MLKSIAGADYVDAHCHLGANSNVPPGVAVIAVTESPDEYVRVRDAWKGSSGVVVALGLHPLRRESHRAASRRAFSALVHHAMAIGEVGLDFSVRSEVPRGQQIATFREVMALSGDRIVSLHSRGAERELLDELERAGPGMRGVLHWFSGSARQVDRAAAMGLYFSINPAMAHSNRGRQVIAAVPRDRVLVESDAPFATVAGRPTTSADVPSVVRRLARQWSVDESAAALQVRMNLDRVAFGELTFQTRIGI